MGDTTKADIRFPDRWCLWYHYDMSSWTPASFKSLATISSVGELWAVIDGLLSTENLLLEHLYVMREGIAPVWEDKRNRNGGCWSIKVDLKDAVTIFVKILAHVLGENSLFSSSGENLSKHITGVSFCSKNSYSVITQAWVDDKNLHKINLLHPNISGKFLAEIIFRSHVPEY